MSLVKVKVRIKRRDTEDPEKEITQFEDFLMNPLQIESAMTVPGATNVLVKMTSGDNLLVKGTLAAFEKACK